MPKLVKDQDLNLARELSDSARNVRYNLQKIETEKVSILKELDKLSKSSGTEEDFGIIRVKLRSLFSTIELEQRYLDMVAYKLKKVEDPLNDYKYTMEMAIATLKKSNIDIGELEKEGVYGLITLVNDAASALADLRKKIAEEKRIISASAKQDIGKEEMARIMDSYMNYLRTYDYALKQGESLIQLEARNKRLLSIKTKMESILTMIKRTPALLTEHDTNIDTLISTLTIGFAIGGLVSLAMGDLFTAMKGFIGFSILITAKAGKTYSNTIHNNLTFRQRFGI